jgi:hypothetical protein
LTEPLQVGQFAIVDHEPVDRGPNAGVFHGKGPTDDRAELFIVAEGTTPAGEAFAGHVVSALGQAFNTLDMSLTGALKRLFEEAERNLLDWNRKSIAQHRVSIGLSAFGRRGGQTVIAQAGPSAVFHLHDGVVTPYFTDEEHGRPIGAGPVHAQLTRIDFAAGDRLLMITTPALAELDDEVIEGVLKLPEPQILQDLYHRLKDVRHLTTVLVTGSPAAPPMLPPADDGFVIDATAMLPAPAEDERERAAATASENTYQPSLFINAQAEDAVVSARKLLMEVTPRRQIEAAAPSVVTEMPAPLLRVSGESPLAQLAAERQARASLAHAALANAAAVARQQQRTTAGVGSRGTSEFANGGPPPARRRHERRDSFSRGLVRDEIPARPSPTVEAMPLVDEMAAEHRARGSTLTASSKTIAGDAAATLSSGGSLVRVRENMGGRWKGGGSFSRRPTANASLPPTWLVILCGLGVLLVLIGFITIPRLLSEQSSQRYASLIDGAQQRLSTARVLPDPAQRRQTLTDAQAMLLEAKDSKPNDADAAQILQQVNSAIAAMDDIKTPAAVDVVGSLEQFGDKPVSVARMVVSDDTAYILDNASGQVIAMTLATGNRKVVFGQDADKHQGRPVATAFLDSSDFSGPVALIADQSHQLWSYSPANGLAAVPFAAPAGVTITDIAISGRDLYLLDANAAVIYRFTQGDTGYNVAPAKAIETPDLAAARRLMVDGDIITADANGQLHSFTGQLALQLSQGGIDKKLVADATPQTLAKNGDLGFLDAPNDRIVFFRRDGTFAVQYRQKDFAASSAFAVRNGIGYVFSGGKLRKVSF